MISIVIFENKRYRKPKGQSRMDNTEKLSTLGTQDEEKENKKHNTIYVGYHYTQTNTLSLYCHGAVLSVIHKYVLVLLVTLLSTYNVVNTH